MGEVATAAVFAGMAANGIFSAIWALPRHEMAHHEQTLERLRSALGDKEFAERVTQGGAMTYHEMVTFALRTLNNLCAGTTRDSS
jgi:hypothetical protein